MSVFFWCHKFGSGCQRNIIWKTLLFRTLKVPVALKRTCFSCGQCTVKLINSFWEGLWRQNAIDVVAGIQQPLFPDFPLVLLQQWKDVNVCFGLEHQRCVLAGNEVWLAASWSQVELPKKQSKAGPGPGRTGWGPRTGRRAGEGVNIAHRTRWRSPRLQPPGTSGNSSSYEVNQHRASFWPQRKILHPLMPLPSLPHSSR